MMVGSYYFMGTGSDWAYTSGYGYLYNRYLDSTAKAQGVDLKKAQVLKEYIEHLEEKIHMLNPNYSND
jgi:hypothetical protein